MIKKENRPKIKELSNKLKVKQQVEIPRLEKLSKFDKNGIDIEAQWELEDALSEVRSIKKVIRLLKREK